MTRSDTRIVAFVRVLHWTRNLSKFVITTVAALLLVVTGASAQSLPTDAGVADLLGPHSDGARGCAVCHASRSAQAAPAQAEAMASAPAFLWGSNRAPDYGSAVPLADGARWAEVRPAAGESHEVTGVLLCLSCHDGNLTPHNMLESWSYEYQVGLLAQTQFRSQKIPSLLGRDEEPANDHPIGGSAPINPGGGLVFSNGTFAVLPHSPYAQFVANYGWPSLAPGKRSSAYGVSRSGEPYTLCTTCHDQHVRNIYVSGGSSPIAGDASGKVYTTYFFLNGPYNPAPDKLAGYPTTSSAQFCRQCHFDLSNEGNNMLTARTFF
jgi:hypothetical protein